ncbi:MAG: DUF4142 domain-containing protein, partial [Gemmataceae bacterium]|nr:DUF4142 domain-containing protein [Gemmataceae bacterium]
SGERANRPSRRAGHSRCINPDGRARRGENVPTDPEVVMVLKKSFVAALSLVLAAVLVARSDDKKGDDKKPAEALDDATFVKKAASGGLHEVELGKLAATKAKSDEVKRFAEQMVKDHTKANEELKAAAKAAGVEVPTKMMEKQQKELDKFSGYKDQDFDRAYLKHAIAHHEESADLYTRGSKELKSKELKEFATKTLPVVQKHLEMAKKLDK